MARIVLHVGMHKTGSSSIQKSLRNVELEIREKGVFYPDVPPNSANPGIGLYSAYSENQGYYQILKWGYDTPEKLSKLKHEVFETIESAVKHPDCTTVILSGEDLCMLLPDRVAQLAEHMRSLSEDVSVIVYVRDPIGYATSAAQELVRGGELLSRVYLYPPTPKYSDRIGPYLDAFGRDVVDIRVFPPRGAGVGVVADFTAAAGLSEEVRGMIPEVRTNTSMSEFATHIMSAANRKFPPLKDGKVNNDRALNLEHWIDRIAGGKFRLPDFSAERVIAQARADVDWLSEQLGFEPFPDWTKVAEKTPDRDSEGPFESVAVLVNDLRREADWRRTQHQVALAEVEFLQGQMAQTRGEAGLAREHFTKALQIHKWHNRAASALAALDAKARNRA